MTSNTESEIEARAREIAAKLLPHTTSVHNVEIIKSALLAERSRPAFQPGSYLSELIAHLATTDAGKDPEHTNSIMRMARQMIYGMSTALPKDYSWAVCTNWPRDSETPKRMRSAEDWLVFLPQTSRWLPPSAYLDIIRAVQQDAIAIEREHATPAGWKLVPAEPTEEMIHAAIMTHVRENKGIEHSPYLSYKAMLAAAPPIPQTKG